MKKKQKTVHLLPNTNIVIDYWKSIENEDRFIRFMTIFRMENDQLQCMKQNNYKIYTSANNKKLLEFHEIPTDRIIAIDPGTCIEIVDEYAKYSFKVSTIESNYCVGSCMFLFQGPFGNILYTGFFRPAKTNNPLRDQILENLIQHKSVHKVYIDNSYAAEHCQFPSRADVIKDAVKLIKKHTAHKIIIFGNKFGKEEILRDIAMSLDEPIGVSKSKFEELSFIVTQECLQRFSPDQDECRVVVEDELLSLQQCKKIQAKEGLCIIILLTAQYICAETRCGQPVPELSNLHILPYSSHASHCELMEFLYNLKAHEVMPIILTESENTIIPMKMMEMRYTNEDSLSLGDSDFYFDTYSNNQTHKNDYGTVQECTTTRDNNCGSSTNNINDTLMEGMCRSKFEDESMDVDVPPNVGNDFGTVQECMTSHENNCGSSTNNINDTQTEGMCSKFEDESMDVDVPPNVGNFKDEKHSVDTDNTYKESQPVFFVQPLKEKDECLCDETCDDTKRMADPFSADGASDNDVYVVFESVETGPNFVCDDKPVIARSDAVKFEDYKITNSVSGSDINETSLPDDILPLEPDNSRIVESGEDASSAILPLENNHLQTSHDNKELVCYDEISFNDIIRSDGVVGQNYSEALSNEKDHREKEVSGGSGVSLTHSNHSSNKNAEFEDHSSSLIEEFGQHSGALSNGNDQGERKMSDGSDVSLTISNNSSSSKNAEFEDCSSSSKLTKESVCENDMRLGVILYHISLVTTAEDWQKTNLTEDTWNFLQGVEFS